MKSPFLSIITPMYNRETVVDRAIRSCLSQEFDDFEIVVVDDASTDASVAAVERFSDDRIRILRHSTNQGVSVARNTGMASARGEWFVYLDSDDELMPGALATINRRARSLDDDVVAMRFMCTDESGLSPDPPLDNLIWTYERYLRWADSAIFRKQDTLPCARRSTFPTVRFPDSRALEGSYHLDLARLGQIAAWADVLLLVHHDAADRLTVPTISRSLRNSADHAADVEGILRNHGVSIRRHAPEMYALLLASGASTFFMAGQRVAGLRYSARALGMHPWSGRVWIVLFVGLAGRFPLAALQWLKSRVVRFVRQMRWRREGKGAGD
jgi:glycosyltransferase involved in cell wall biosynthesis